MVIFLSIFLTQEITAILIEESCRGVLTCFITEFEGDGIQVETVCSEQLVWQKQNIFETNFMWNAEDNI